MIASAPEAGGAGALAEPAAGEPAGTDPSPALSAEIGAPSRAESGPLELPALAPAPPAAVMAARRQALALAIGTGSIALLQGPAQRPPATAPTAWSGFAYLCADAPPRAYLLVEGSTARSVLYLPASQISRATVPGGTAAELVAPLEQLAHDLHGGVANGSISRCYLAPDDEGADPQQAAETESDPWDGRPRRGARLLVLLAERLPEVELRDLGPVLGELRLVPDEHERHARRRAGALGGLSVREAMRCTRAGLSNEDLLATAGYVCAGGGGALVDGSGVLVSSRTPAKPTSARLHDGLARGDLVLADLETAFAAASARVTRVWPVSGRFSPLQRYLYQLLTAYREALLEGLSPGRSLGSVRGTAVAAMRRHLDAARLPDAGTRAALEEMLAGGVLELLTPGGGAAESRDASRELRSGAAVGVRLRLELPSAGLVLACGDTVALGASGAEVLTELAPATADAIEEALAEPSLLLPFLAARPEWASARR